MSPGSTYRIDRGYALWFIGLSTSGKTTVSSKFKDYLEDLKIPVVLLDGDMTRKIIGEGLGRSEPDRVLVSQRYAHLTSYLISNRVIVLMSAIIHSEAQRTYAREHHPPDSFGLVWINTPLEICKSRDPKGLYRYAHETLERGDSPQDVGIDIPFESPQTADVIVAGNDEPPEEACVKLFRFLTEAGELVRVP